MLKALITAITTLIIHCHYTKQLKQVMTTLMKQYKQKEEELVAFQKEHATKSQ